MVNDDDDDDDDDDDEWLIMGSIRVNDDDFHGFV